MHPNVLKHYNYTGGIQAHYSILMELAEYPVTGKWLPGGPEWQTQAESGMA